MTEAEAETNLPENAATNLKLLNIIYTPQNDPIYRGCLSPSYDSKGIRAIALGINPESRTYDTVSFSAGNNPGIPLTEWAKAKNKSSLKKLIEAGAIAVVEQKDLAADSLKAFKPADQLAVVSAERSISRLKSWLQGNPPAKIVRSIEDRVARLQIKVS